MGARDPSPAEAGREPVAHPDRRATRKPSGAEARDPPGRGEFSLQLVGPGKQAEGSKGGADCPDLLNCRFGGRRSLLCYTVLGGRRGAACTPRKGCGAVCWRARGPWNEEEALWLCIQRSPELESQMTCSGNLNSFVTLLSDYASPCPPPPDTGVPGSFRGLFPPQPILHYHAFFCGGNSKFSM